MTKVPPFKTMFYRDPNLPSENPLLFTECLFSDDDWEAVVEQKLRRAWQYVWEMILEQQKQQKVQYDKRNTVKELTEKVKVGDWVQWKDLSCKKPGMKEKFALPWLGPYQIMEVDLLNLVLEIKGQPKWVHYNQTCPASPELVKSRSQYHGSQKPPPPPKLVSKAGKEPEKKEYGYNLCKNPKQKAGTALNLGRR